MLETKQDTLLTNCRRARGGFDSCSARRLSTRFARIRDAPIKAEVGKGRIQTGNQNRVHYRP